VWLKIRGPDFLNFAQKLRYLSSKLCSEFRGGLVAPKVLAFSPNNNAHLLNYNDFYESLDILGELILLDILFDFLPKVRLHDDWFDRTLNSIHLFWSYIASGWESDCKGFDPWQQGFIPGTSSQTLFLFCLKIYQKYSQPQ